MNRNALIATGMVCASGIVISTMIARAGSLTPPGGVVASTMKDLDTVEPRIPIDPATFGGDADSVVRIVNQGSYYLTGNLQGEPGKHGIEIFTPHVTIDLNGFLLAGGPGLDPTLDGIHVESSGTELVVIKNGMLRNWDGDAIDLGRSVGNRIEDVSVERCDGTGIVSGAQAVVANCVVRQCTTGISGGLDAVVRSCNSSDNTSSGIFTANGVSVIDCTASQNGGDGIFASAGTVIRGCTVRSNTNNGINDLTGQLAVVDCSAWFNTGRGFNLGPGSLIDQCTAAGNGGDGIVIENGSLAINCSANSNTEAGINAIGGSLVRNCVVDGNRNGMLIGSLCLVTQNLCTNNTDPTVGFGAGILVTGQLTHLEQNFSSNNEGQGIRLAGTSSQVRAVKNYHTAILQLGSNNDLAPSNSDVDLTTQPWNNLAEP